ncbi:multicopper oxidase domain-containing protein [Asanoa sp. NPDC049573]|uniref:multicopper oxidase domain-containing protein n=1 Tax=Asanoa sp. NPDC049573 TaxID=3155396 RepID=UPI00343723C7
MARAQKEISRLGWASAPRLLAVATLAVTLVGAGALRFGAQPAAGPPAGVRARQAVAAAPAAQPDGCAKPTRTIQLYAVELAKDPTTRQVRLGYGLTAKTASYPGPTIEMTEGECLAVTLHDNVSSATLESLRGDSVHPLAVSLHAHGVKYTASSDGTLGTNSYVAPGGQRTYYWYAKPRDPATGAQGTAGYWWYHDHMVGGPHGTAGVGAGLFGALIVRRQGDVKPARTYVTAFGDRQTINLRRGSATDTCDATKPVAGPTCLIAKPGERVEFVVIGLGNDMHTFHLHGHSWADTRTGTLDGTDKALVNAVRVIDNKTVGPGDSFGVQVVAGDSVGAGNWMLHCHMQFHSDQGMSTMLHVLNADGTVAPHSADHAPSHL